MNIRNLSSTNIFSPKKFDDISWKLKSEIENYHYKQQLPEYQRKFYEDQARLERLKAEREMPKPVKKSIQRNWNIRNIKDSKQNWNSKHGLML